MQVWQRSEGRRRPRPHARRRRRGSRASTSRSTRAGPTLTGVRLAKYIAHAGVGSRRTAEGLIAEGRVAVDGELVTDPARDVDDHRRVTVDGRELAPEPRELYILNKPAGVVATARDTHGRPTVLDFVPSGRRLYPVGRLDADTTGLILLTNDGELANRLTHPRYEVEKVYRAEVEPAEVGGEALRALRAGVKLDDGRTLPARVEQTALGVLELALREGRKRQVRRMCEAVGHHVVVLRRVAFGPLLLGDLAEGDSRPLTAAELAGLHEAASVSSADRPPRPAAPAPGTK
jgi:23S rRNA pseudouridine2605 synthase